MIVKCEQCQTRFKIPDERVTEKGVKVRCTKCQHMFRVTREMGQSAAAPAPPRAAAAPQQAPEYDPFARFGGPSDASAHEETRPGVFALGVEASKVPDMPLAPPPEPIRSTSSPGQPFDFSTLAPSAPAPPKKAPPPAPRVAPQAAQPAPFDFAGLTSTPSPPAPRVSPGPSPFDFSALGPTTNSPTEPLAFDFGTLGPATALPPPQASAPPPNFPPPPAFDFSALGPSTSTASTTKVAAFEPNIEVDVAPPPRPSAPLFDDVPDLNEPASGPSSTIDPPPNVPDDFFGTPLSPPPSAPRAPGSYRGAGGTKEDLFDMPQPVAAPDPSAPRPSQVVALPVTMSQPRVTGANDPTPSQSGKRRGAFGVIINLAIAVVLVAALIVIGSALVNEGKVDSTIFSPARLKALVARETDYEATDISNGLYDTVRGKPVFYVRGEVTNHSPSPTRVRIRAEILDGETMVRAAEVVAGTPPTPEQLRNLTAADEVERLLATVSKTAPSLAPGESAPFLVTFFEYPPDLKAFRVRVSARAQGAETAER